MATIEQKAIAYDKAIEKIKYAMDHGVQPVLNKEDLLDIFTELKEKESEDERIRGAIIDHLKDSNLTEWAAWLEKQGEQKPDDKIEPKFKVGDWCIDNEDGTIFQIVKVLDNTYKYRTNEGKEYSCTHYSLELDARLWTIQDAKDGDVLVDSLGNVCIYQEPSTKLMYHSHCYGNHKDFMYMGGSHEIVGSYPATKEQRDKLEKAMANAGYAFDFEKKELREIENEEYDGDDYGIDGLWHAKNILEKTIGKVDGYQTDDGILDHKCAITAVDKLYKQKPAEWSEEDESNFQMLIDVIKENKHHATDYEHMTYYKLLSWFKLLKERYVWKPSYEQIDAL